MRFQLTISIAPEDQYRLNILASQKIILGYSEICREEEVTSIFEATR